MGSSQHTVYIVVYSFVICITATIVILSCQGYLLYSSYIPLFLSLPVHSSYIICFLCVVHKLTISFIRGSHLICQLKSSYRYCILWKFHCTQALQISPTQVYMKIKWYAHVRMLNSISLITYFEVLGNMLNNLK